jgi:Serine carboxypeptidase
MVDGVSVFLYRGVGFSYSDDPADYLTNDNMTALDTSIFLDKFFQIYSEFSNNDFWITGESVGSAWVRGVPVCVCMCAPVLVVVFFFFFFFFFFWLLLLCLCVFFFFFFFVLLL